MYVHTISKLRSVTCHIRSHSVIDPVNTPRPNPSDAGRLSIYLIQGDNRLSWQECLAGHRQTVTHPNFCSNRVWHIATSLIENEACSLLPSTIQRNTRNPRPMSTFDEGDARIVRNTRSCRKRRNDQNGTRSDVYSCVERLLRSLHWVEIKLNALRRVQSDLTEPN